MRAEYAHLDDETFRTGRRAFAEATLAMPAIYATDAGRAHWEGAARRNLGRELEGLIA